MNKNKKKQLFQNFKKDILFKLSLLILIIFLIISMSTYFKIGLFLKDKYGWYIYFGEKYFILTNFEKSIEYANKAIYLDEKRYEAHLLKGENYIKLGKYDLAEKEFEFLKHKRLDMYYWNMGKINLEQGNLNKSMEYFRRGMGIGHFKQNPRISHLYAGIGFIYSVSNKTEAALDYYNKSALYFEQSPEKKFIAGFVHTGLGRIYERERLYQKADEEFENAKSLGGSGMRYFNYLVSLHPHQQSYIEKN